MVAPLIKGTGMLVHQHVIGVSQNTGQSMTRQCGSHLLILVAALNRDQSFFELECLTSWVDWGRGQLLEPDRPAFTAGLD